MPPINEKKTTQEIMARSLAQVISAITNIRTRNLVESWLASWTTCSDPTCKQIAANIKNERSLCAKSFVRLLARAGKAWSKAGILTVGDFDKLCASYKMRGCKLAKPTPLWLGRAEKIEAFIRRRQRANPGIPLDDFAAELSLPAEVSPGLPAQDTDEILLRVEVSPIPSSFPTSSLFATFAEDRVSFPFDGSLRNRGAVVNSLGLGYAKITDWLVVVIYRPEGRLSLHVPTIADAGNYHYFRPVRRGGRRRPRQGKTYPLRPEPGIEPQAEAVHQECGWIFVGMC